MTFSDTTPPGAPEEHGRDPSRGPLFEAFAAATRPVRVAGRGLLRGLERQAHPLRRRLALRRIRRRGPLRRVLFVCHGNICRSPYGEFRLRHLLEDALGTDADPPPVVVSSVGFVHPGRPVPRAALEVAGRRGLDLGEHHSRVLTMPNLRGADLVLVMTGRQRRDLLWSYGVVDVVHLGDLDPGPIEARDVFDPYGHPPEVFEEVYARLDRILGELAALVVASLDEAGGG
jgi:protein-tyrosine phosphatase